MRINVLGTLLDGKRGRSRRYLYCVHQLIDSDHIHRLHGGPPTDDVVVGLRVSILKTYAVHVLLQLVSV